MSGDILHHIIRWNVPFSTSPQETDMIKMLRVLFERFIDAVCYAA
jgi:hypothetical protein